jgi:tetratricopeptide (TPR) repeat protein
VLKELYGGGENIFSATQWNFSHNGKYMNGIQVQEMRTTLLLLIENQQYDRISSVLDHSIRNLNDVEDWNVLFELFHHIPNQIRVESIPLGLHFARTLSRTNHSQELFDFCDTMLERYGIARVAELEVERSIELYVLRRYQDCLSTLESAMKHLEGQALGFAYSKLGLVLYALEKPWQQAFEQARYFMSGLELGKALINEGYCFAESHQTAQAQGAWQEALVYLHGNPRLLTWVRYNLGITALRDMNVDAERHFLDGLKLSQNLQASGLRVSILIGLGAIRRSLGEWSRAEFAYREAIKLAQDPNNLREATFGLVRTLRLSGRYSEALESLEVALHDPTLEHQLFYVARALSLLTLGQTKRAKDALEKWVHWSANQIAGSRKSLGQNWLDKKISLIRQLVISRDCQFTPCTPGKKHGSFRSCSCCSRVLKKKCHNPSSTLQKQLST